MSLKKKILGDLKGEVDGGEAQKLISAIVIVIITIFFGMLIVGMVSQTADDMINETENPELQDALDGLTDNSGMIWTLLGLVAFVMAAAFIIGIFKKISG